MSNQTSSEPQLTSEQMSRDFMKVDNALDAFYHHKQVVSDYEEQAALAKRLGEKPPAKPTKTEAVKLGEQYKALEDKTSKDMAKRLERRQKDEQAKKTNIDNRQQVESLISEIQKTTESPEQLVKVAAAINVLLKHRRDNPEFWQDLSTLLSTREDLFQLEKSMPSTISQILSDTLDNDPKSFANEHVLTVLDKLLKAPNKEDLQQKIFLWKNMGIAMKGFFSLEKTSHIGPPLFKTKGLDLAFGLTKTQYNQLVSSGRETMAIDSLPEKFASLVLTAPENERLELAGKTLGILKAHLLTYFDNFTDNSKNSSERLKIVQRAVVKMIPDDQNLISGLKREQTLWLPEIMLSQITDMAGYEENQIFQDQYNRYIKHQNALRAQEDEKKAKDQQQADEANLALKQQAFTEEKQNLQDLQQNSHYQKLISQLLNREPNQANLDQARQLINRNSSSENPDPNKLTPSQAELFKKIIDAYQTIIQKLFTTQDEEISIKTGFLSLKKDIQTHVHYFIDPEKQARLHTKTQELEQDNNPEALLNQVVLDWASKLDKKVFVKTVS